MSKNEEKLLDKISDLWNRLENHPTATIPVPGTIGNFFPLSTVSYCEDVNLLKIAVLELNELHNNDLFEFGQLMSTINGEVENVKNSKNLAESSIAKYIEKANDHLFRDLRKVKELINNRNKFLSL